MKQRTLVLLILLLALAMAAPAMAGPVAEGAAIPSRGGWLPMRTAVAPAGQRFLGPFERQTVTLLVADLPAHSQITLRFDFYAIATWDGNAGGDIGPDIFSVTHSNDQPLLQTTFSNYVDQPQAYPDAYPGGSHPGQTGAVAVGSLGYPHFPALDSVYNLSFTFAHTGATLPVKFAGVGLQGYGDEPWGLDNVAVEADGQVVYTFDAESDMSGPVVEVAQLLAADRQADDTLGRAVAVQEDLLAVGAPVEVADNLLDQNQRAGALYLFARNPSALYQWAEIQKLTPGDGAPNDRFGWTVALDANLLVVGAPWADMGGNRDQGAVYLFARSQADPNRWEQIQKLVAPDGAAADRFGRALALNGGGLVIGAKEKAYVFYRRGADQWSLVKTLTASDGQPEDRYGDSVALDGDIILIGASGAPIGANYLQGAAYLYQRNQGGADNWGAIKKLTAPDGDVFTFFGHPVLLANQQAIIGGVGKQQIYIFSRNFGGVESWAEVQRLTSMDGRVTYGFGSHLAYQNGRLLVGTGNRGELFERVSGDVLWLPLRKLQGSAGSGADFASSFALWDNLAFVGAPSVSSPDQGWHGALYLFDVTRPAAPTVRFAQSDYAVQESGGNARVQVVLDRPSPYPLAITYDTSLMEHEALPGEDYTPVSGTLSIATGATEGVINVPITNDEHLELTERLNINLGRVAGGLLGELNWATVTILDDDTVGACDFVAHDEESLDRAIRCLYVAEPTPVTIQVTDNISLTHPLPTLTSPQMTDVIIEGNGHTIDAQGHGRVLAMYKIKVDMRNLTLRGGRVPMANSWPNPNYGGGLYADTPNIGFGIEPSCALTLTNVVITDNEAFAGGGLYYGCELPLQMTNSTVSNNRAIVGGAFSTAGGEEFFTNLFINRSTFSGNSAQQNGGSFDLSSGDGVVILELANSTVSGNRVISGTGGGLWITQASHDGLSETHLINSTIANNAANQGSGVYNRYGILRLSNSLIADNQGASNCIFFTSEDGNGQMLSLGYNLDSDGSCLSNSIRQPSDIPSGNANLGPLADNGAPGGHPTLTQALLEGSAARDAAHNAVCLAAPVGGVDQRGVSRPQGLRCDIGAYEAEAAAVTSSVVAWGWNDGGQLNLPAGLHDVIALAGGYGHSIALQADGTVVAWGRNQEEQTAVPDGLTDVTAIASGYQHNLAVKRDGTVVAWGWNGYGQTAVPAHLRDVVAVAGGYHSLALTSNGLLVAWGLNNEGQATIPSDLYGVTAIAAGIEHSLALKRDGTVVAWGYNGNGEATVPADLHDVVAIAAGWFHSLALKRDGTVVAWGANDFGQSTVPAGLTDVVAIAGGGYHSLALKRDGTLVAWGNNEFGQTTVPAGVHDVTVMAAGGWHTLAAVTTTSNNLLFVSSSSSGQAGGVSFRDEDIVAYDRTTNAWQMLFDGSDLGVTKDVDAFAFLADGSLLLSFNTPTDVPGLGLVDDSDIVQFIPTTLGSTTAGSFALYLRGADVGLTTDGEDIDAIGFTTDGHLVVSTIGDFNTPTLSGKDEDLIAWDKASGAWRMFLDGSTVGLANEDVNSLWIDPANGEVYMTVKDSFAFGNVQIDSDDIFVCTPSSSGASTSCAYRRFWDSDVYDYGSENLDAIGLGVLPPTFGSSAQSSTAEALTHEEMATDDDIDDVNVEELIYPFFLPWVGR